MSSVHHQIDKCPPAGGAWTDTLEPLGNGIAVNQPTHTIEFRSRPPVKSDLTAPHRRRTPAAWSVSSSRGAMMLTVGGRTGISTLTELDAAVSNPSLASSLNVTVPAGRSDPSKTARSPATPVARAFHVSPRSSEHCSHTWGPRPSSHSTSRRVDCRRRSPQTLRYAAEFARQVYPEVARRVANRNAPTTCGVGRSACTTQGKAIAVLPSQRHPAELLREVL